MSPSILSFPTIFLTSSILILISTSISPVQCRRRLHRTLVDRACSNASTTIDTQLCHRVLKTIPKVTSAKDLPSLTIAIVEAGISNSTHTRRYIEAALRRGSGGSGAYKALGQCKQSYDEILSRFSSALKQIKARNYEYQATSYQLQSASTDCVRTCAIVLAQEGVADEVVLRGNHVVPIFGISAISIIRDLTTA